MSTPGSSTSATAVTVARLSAHIARRGLSATGLARQMGRSHTWILRKLDPDHAEARPLMLEDLDAIAAHLGTTGAELMAPCLTPAEAGALASIRDGTADSRAELAEPGTVDTLIAQGLVTESGAGVLTLANLAA